MQNAWVSAFKSTSKPAFRSLVNGALSASREGPVHRPLWSSIAGGVWRTEVLNCKFNHDRHVSRRQTPFLRSLHTTRPCLKRRTRNTPPATTETPQPDKATRIRIPFGSKTRQELAAIFGQEVDYNGGNEALRILHGRRVTGALVDRGVSMDDDGLIPDTALNQALEWLRANHPVDEQKAAVAWAEAERMKISQQYIERAERLGLYKKIDEPEEEGNYSTTQTGRSAIEELRKHNEEKAEKARQEKIKSGEEQKNQELRLARQEDLQKRQVVIEEKRAERQKKGMVSDMEEVPDLSSFQRLFGSTALSFVILYGLYWWASTYTAPPLETRIFRDTPASVATIGTIIAINLTVLLLWRLPPLWKFLNKYTIVVPAYPISASIFGNIFSHQSFTHLLGNMSGLVLWGVSLHETIGRAAFVSLYISGGVVGALSSLFAHVVLRRFTTSSQGSSGAVYAIAIAWSYLYWDKPALPDPDGADLTPFILDIARWSVLVLVTLPHFLPAFWAKTDGMAHMGGVLVGFLGAVGIQGEKVREKKRKEAEERYKGNTIGEVV